MLRKVQVGEILLQGQEGYLRRHRMPANLAPIQSDLRSRIAMPILDSEGVTRH